MLKCRVIDVDRGRQRLKLSLLSKKDTPSGKAGEGGEGAAAPADPLGGLQAGALVSGTVRAVHSRAPADGGAAAPHSFEIEVDPGEGTGAAVGRLDVAHLADHPVAATALAAVLAAGARLGPLLVLQRMEGAKELRLSRKASLIAAAEALPRAVAAVPVGQVLPGYVASVTGDAVYVR